jgi:hypothetical protein
MSEQSTTMKDHITIEGRDGASGAYISRPKTLPAPAVDSTVGDVVAETQSHDFH